MTTAIDAKEKSTVTLNNGQTATLYYDNSTTKKAFENINITDPSSVEAVTYDSYVSSAKKGLDRSVLEGNDLGPKEKLEYAKLNDYGKYYDMEIVTGPNGEACFKITVKDNRAKVIGKKTPLTDITSDFGIRDLGILKEYNPDYTHRYTGTVNKENGEEDWNSMSADPGESFILPIDKIDVTGGIQGFKRKFFAINCPWF